MTEAQVGAVAPEALVTTPAADAAPAPETTAVPGSEVEAQPEQPPERTFTQKELDEIVQKRIAKESRRAERVARAEAERDFYKQQVEARQVQQPQARGEPDPKDYKDFESFNAALIEHRVEKALAEKLAQREQGTIAEHQQREAMERGERLRQKLAQAEAKHGPEIRDVLSDPDLPFNGAILAYIEHSKIGGEVALHLATNRADATRIAALAPIQQVIELHALESKLTAPPKTTQAPPPITPNSTAGKVDKDPSAMTDAEFAAWRKRQIAAKKGR